MSPNGEDGLKVVPSRDINAFLIRCAARLEVPDRCLHTAIMIMHNMKDKEIMKSVCNHSLALAAFSVACKIEEDRTGRNLRDFSNVGFAILQNLEEAPETDSLFRHARRGLASLEFVVLREIEYKTEPTHTKPLQYLHIYLRQLYDWQPDKFAKNDTVQKAMTILKDCHLVPKLIKDHEPQEIAIACISIALTADKLDISGCGKRGREEWYETLYPNMTASKLCKLHKKIFDEVFGVRIKV